MSNVVGIPLDLVADAVADIACVGPVVVFDDEHRENEGDLVFAAQHATERLLTFTVRHTSGYICAPMEAADCDRLDLPPMRAVNQCPRGTSYAMPVDARAGVSTGISAADRALTLRLLADPGSGPDDFTRPGHVVPLRAVPGGVLRRRGHTEAALDLVLLAGCSPASVLCELVSDDGSMQRLPELRRFADRHDLRLISIADLADHRMRLGDVAAQVAAPA